MRPFGCMGSGGVGIVFGDDGEASTRVGWVFPSEVFCVCLCVCVCVFRFNFGGAGRILRDRKNKKARRAVSQMRMRFPAIFLTRRATWWACDSGVPVWGVEIPTHSTGHWVERGWSSWHVLVFLSREAAATAPLVLQFSPSDDGGR